MASPPTQNGMPLAVPITNLHPNYVYVPATSLAQSSIINSLVTEQMTKSSHSSLSKNSTSDISAEGSSLKMTNQIGFFSSNHQQQHASVENMINSDGEDIKCKVEIEEEEEPLLEEPFESDIWKENRVNILSKLELWDVLVDKALFSYISECRLKKSSFDNIGKVQAVINELEGLLGQFKCFMDACLTERENNDDIIIGPELCRAFEQKTQKAWSLKKMSVIHPLYQSFFNTNDLEVSIHEMESEKANFHTPSPPEDLSNDMYLSDDPLAEVEMKPHFCDFCGRKFRFEHNLKKHQEKCPSQLQPTKQCKWFKRTEDSLIVCDFKGCDSDAVFTTTLQIWHHFQDEHALSEDFIYRCHHCQACFVHPQILHEHQEMSHPCQEGSGKKVSSSSSAAYNCKYCSASFSKLMALTQHKRKEHSSKRNTSSSSSMKENYKCDLCDFSTSAQNGLSLHKRRLHKVDKDNVSLGVGDAPDYHLRDPAKFKHQCERCTRRYKKIHHLERHQAKCDGIPPPTFKPMWEKNEQGRFVCAVPGCMSEKSWTSSFSVWHHFNAEHADMQDDSYCVFKCDMCDKKFPNKSMLTRHRTHKHESLFRFQCAKCSKRLPSNKLLRLHMTQHTGEKPFSCEFCDYKAITNSLVNQHKRRMHEDLIPEVLPRHVCDICGKSFKVRSNLKEHMASHSDARSFLCGMCGKSLKNRQCLNRHLFTHGVKQTCQICNKNFANATTLSIHQRDKHGLRS